MCQCANGLMGFMDTDYRLLITDYRLLNTRYPLPVTRYPSPVTRYPLPHNHSKHINNIMLQLLLCFVDINFLSQFFLQGGCFFIGKATGIDVVEVFELGVNIECKPVH